MTPRRLAAASLPFSLALAVTVATALPASARTSAVTDPTGDAGGGPDVTRVVVANRAHAVVAHVSLAAVERGHVIVSIDRRHGQGRSLVSLRGADGSTRDFVLGAAFTDERPAGRVSCGGFRVTWQEDGSGVTMRMPSRCLHHGAFGAVRFSVLTEAGSGADADYAPQDRQGELSSSAWIPRG
jgi:hypothetical protein